MLKMQRTSPCIWVLLTICITIVSCEPWNLENENPIYTFSPLQEEVDRCKADYKECEEFSTYPSAHIEKLIKENKIKKEWFESNEENMKDKFVKMKTNNIDDDKNQSRKNLCETNNTSLYPKGGILESGEFIYIVQLEVNNVSYYQKMEVELCSRNKLGNFTCQVEDDRSNQETYLRSDEYDFNCTQMTDVVNNVGVTTRGEVVNIRLSYNSTCMCVCHKK